MSPEDVWFRLLRAAPLIGILSVLSLAQSCVYSYDVRHVRWGMTREQVMRAEAANKPQVVSPTKEGESQLVEKDVVAGISSEVNFYFTGDRLDSLSVGLDIDDSNASSALEAAESADAAERAVNNWNEVLQKKYGKGVIVFDSPKIPRVRTGHPYEVSEAIYILQHALQTSSFDEDFENTRTRAKLSCHKLAVGDTQEPWMGMYYVTIFFEARPQESL